MLIEPCRAENGVIYCIGDKTDVLNKNTGLMYIQMYNRTGGNSYNKTAGGTDGRSVRDQTAE